MAFPLHRAIAVRWKSCLVQTEVSVDVSREPTLWAMAFPSERRMKMESSARPPRVWNAMWDKNRIIL